MSAIGIHKNGSNILERFRSVRGKTIVITGGGRGLGLNFANGLAQAGANIAAIDIAEEPRSDFAHLSSYGGKIEYYSADVQDYKRMEAVVDSIAKDFGTIYGCIPAAGIIGIKPFMSSTVEEFTATISVNLISVFTTVQLCATHMIANGSGSIVIISSVAGHKATTPKGYSAYVASKHGVRGLAKQIASELAPYNIRCNSISPGTIVTNMLESLMDNADEKQRFENGNMLKRLGQVDELNGTVLLLMSDAGSYMTGDDVLVDAGAAA